MPGKFILFILTIFVLSSCQNKDSQNIENTEYSGSESCIECHERFYELWSPSHHGKAMQIVDNLFLKENILPLSGEFELEGKKYRIVQEDSSLVMLENSGSVSTRFIVEWALGGKNVYYFLTPLEKGKLQTIPLAYNLNKREWYNNPESAIRHFPDAEVPDEALPWKDRMYTFNTSCYSCHVSQLSTNFDLKSDSYKTTWKEAGINCETCHGPSAEHVALFKSLKEGDEIPKDIRLIVTKTFSPGQHNSSCAPCHAKMQPITASFMPGDRYYDNYSLTTLENNDFYPDGRDLGENYTMTGWGMNQCVINSEMHCVTCHTSSGRYRFKGENTNNACLPCHETRVNDVVAHSHHDAGTDGAMCVNCHMPKTEFGNMIRSDHSFRPPMPLASFEFDSPNACNICHDDKSTKWAVDNVNEWHPDDSYRKETIRWAKLLKEAREMNWGNLDQMLAIIDGQSHDEVVITSFIRLLGNCSKDRKWNTIMNSFSSGYPLVRSAVSAALLGNYTDEAKQTLLKACNDDYRLVRVSAALPLAGFPVDRFTPTENQLVAKVTEEYRQSLVTRTDDWSSHYNMGIFHQNRGEADKALASYETSVNLYPEAIMPLINSSVLYSYIGNTAMAETNLKKAVEIDPGNEAANLNLGLLLAELGKIEEAKGALEKALNANPNQVVAAYNLSVIWAQASLFEAIKYAEIAARAMPEDPKYGYTLAYYQNEVKNFDKAINTLKEVLKANPDHVNSIYFLGQVYQQTGKTELAKQLYRNSLENNGIPDEEKMKIQQVLASLNQ